MKDIFNNSKIVPSAITWRKISWTVSLSENSEVLILLSLFIWTLLPKSCEQGLLLTVYLRLVSSKENSSVGTRLLGALHWASVHPLMVRARSLIQFRVHGSDWLHGPRPGGPATPPLQESPCGLKSKKSNLRMAEERLVKCASLCTNSRFSCLLSVMFMVVFSALFLIDQISQWTVRIYTYPDEM